MLASPHLRSRESLLGLVALVSIIAFGCREAEQIRSYSAPKETKPVAKTAAPAATPGEPTDRMLAAILPAGGQAYFFKVVGPIAAVDTHEKELNDFFAAGRLGDDGKAKWQLPAGWKEQAGNAMRLATIVIPADGKPLEVSVTALPWAGTPEGMLSNVNRWRGQLQLPLIDAGKLAESTREIKAGDRPMTIVDLRGQFAGSGMTPPFAGGPVGGPGQAAPNAPPSGLPPGHPPIDSAVTPPNAPAPPPGPPAVATNDVPKFTTPTDWKAQPADGFRKAAFAIGEGQQGALVTLINFPASGGPNIADPLPNVNRWRQEVGLPDLKADELTK